ncbi:MAG TPA: hypothetical protein PKK84_02115 [Armatimonadota bacterium]|nr:hypothetical protein [Armatimonadota bacterium]
MGTNDDWKNPLNLILPAGVVALLASPKFRAGVRDALVKGVAGIMDLSDRAAVWTEDFRREAQVIVEDARKRRETAKSAPTEPTVTVADPALDG